MTIYISVWFECGREASKNLNDEQLWFDPYDLETPVKPVIHPSSTREDGTCWILAQACQSFKWVHNADVLFLQYSLLLTSDLKYWWLNEYVVIQHFSLFWLFNFQMSRDMNQLCWRFCIISAWMTGVSQCSPTQTVFLW